MFNQFKNRFKQDDGVSVTIEFMITILLLFVIIMSFIDFSMYFNNRQVVTNSAQNGARTVAIFGGTSSNELSRRYGSTTSPEQRVKDGIGETGLALGTVTSVECGPPKTNRVGDRTYCTVEWEYKGLPGSALALSRIHHNTTTVTAESEVVTGR